MKQERKPKRGKRRRPELDPVIAELARLVELLAALNVSAMQYVLRLEVAAGERAARDTSPLAELDQERAWRMWGLHRELVEVAAGDDSIPESLRSVLAQYRERWPNRGAHDPFTAGERR